MNIAIIAQDSKKELMIQFCIAYCGILAKHKICATATTGKMVADATGLKIERVQPGTMGGWEQIASRIEYNQIDLVLLFRDPMVKYDGETTLNYVMRSCDNNSIPIATNVATAEVLIQGLIRGDFAWREIVNPQ